MAAAMVGTKIVLEVFGVVRLLGCHGRDTDTQTPLTLKSTRAS